MRVLGLAIAATLARLAAQTTGDITGTVTDPSGRAVQQATVEIVATMTGARRQVASDRAGLFHAPGMTPGEYSVEVSAAGFRPLRQTGVALAAGQTARIAVRLEISAAQQAVEVRADAMYLSASASAWGLSLSKDKLRSLPLNGRDIFELAQQQPDVTMPPAASHSALAYGQGQRFSVNGARPNQNAIRIDGIFSGDSTGNAPASAAARSLGVEAIEEISLITSPFSAEYGRMAGGLMTAISKSGTNHWHGSGYEYLRNSAMDAKNFFDTQTEKIPDFRRNQFGGLLGGPIQRNKLFAIFNYEGLRETASRSQNVTVPNANARQGLIPGSNGAPVTVAIAPAVRPYLALYPLPNGQDFGDGTGNFNSAPATSTREQYVSGKVDWVRSERWRMAGRYVGDTSESATKDPFSLWDFAYQSRYHILHFDSQWVQSPRTLHQFRLGASRVWNRNISISSGVPENLRFVPGKEMGTIQVTGLVELGTARPRTSPQQLTNNDAQFSYLVSRTAGAHMLKIGGGLHWIQSPRLSGSSEVGSYAFDSLTAFLQGRPRSGDVLLPGATSALLFRQNIYHMFFQDDFRVNRFLNLSAGLRYEPYSALRETHGRSAKLSLPIETARIEMTQALYRNLSLRNFTPRVGLAWDPKGDGKTALRLGAGIFTDVLGTSILTPARSMGGDNYRRVAVLNPPFPDLLRVAAQDTSLPTLDTLDYDALQPKVIQLQAAVQRQMGGRTFLHASYIHTRGIHLAGFVGSVNPARPTVDAAGEVFFPAGAARMNPKLDRISLTRTQFDLSHNALATSLEHRFHNGLQLSVRYAWSRTIDNSSTGVLRDYAGTDFVPNPFDYRKNRGLSDYFLGHVFGMNFSWASPAKHRLLRGWELSGLGQAQSGSPFSPRTGFDRTRLLASGSTGDLGQRPDVAGPAEILGTADRYFNPATFLLPPAGYFGNAGRNTLIGPGLVNFDGALQRRFAVSERHALLVRGEVFNAANRPNLQIPSATSLFTSSGQRVGSAGRITETATPSRQMQLAIRWAF